MNYLYLLWAVVILFVPAIFNLLTFKPVEWDVVMGRGFWEDLKIALYIAFPILNWGVGVTTVMYWLFPEDS